MMESGMLIRVKSVTSQLAMCHTTDGVDEFPMVECHEHKIL